MFKKELIEMLEEEIKRVEMENMTYGVSGGVDLQIIYDNHLQAVVKSDSTHFFVTFYIDGDWFMKIPFSKKERNLPEVIISTTLTTLDKMAEL